MSSRGAKLPVVLLDRDIYEPPHRSQYDLVSLDNKRAGFDLGCHLLERGRTKFVYVGNPHVYPSTAERLSGVRKAMSLEGLSLPEENIVDTGDEGYAAIVRRVQAGEVDAAVCNSDNDAALLMRHCQTAEVQIPDQVAIAGFDDQPLARLLSIPLTTVAQPAQGLAIRVISTLRDRMAFPNLPPTTIRLRGELIVREST